MTEDGGEVGGRQTVSAPDSPAPDLPREQDLGGAGPEEQETPENLLRHSIKEIYESPELSVKEKAKRIQELMMSRSAKTRKSPELSPSLLPSEADLSPSYHYRTTAAADGGSEEKAFGCVHYKTNNKILAECCKTWHCCRFCHDEWSQKESDGHTIDRHSIKLMLCQYCHHVGLVGQNCSGCRQQMAVYYCQKCNLFDNDPFRSIFHCDECGICRVGQREKYIHCNKCHGCIDIANHPTRRCIEGSMDADCPICGEQMFSSTLPAMFLRCGHAIHSLCFLQYSRESFQCPVCLKTYGDMSALFKHYDEIMSISQMPPECANIRAEIFCNDCEKRSHTAYHYVIHKCVHCGSYSTTLLRTFVAEEAPQGMATNSGHLSSDDIDRQLVGASLLPSTRSASSLESIAEAENEAEDDNTSAVP